MEVLPQLIINSLITGSIYALAASGLSLTYGLVRVLNFAHGHLMMIGVYVYFLFFVLGGFSILPSAVFTLLLMAGVAFATFRIFVNPFYEINFFLPLVSTLSLSYILEATVSMAFGVNVKSLTVGEMITSYEVLGFYITPIQVIVIVSAVLLLSVMAFLIHGTSFGRQIRALSECSYGAEALGINKSRVSLTVFLIATVLAAFAGVMVGYETNIQPTMGHIFTIKSFAAMILGGLGNVWGTVAGAYLLGLVENLSIGLDFGGYSLPAGYKDAFSFLMILLVLLFRPQGLFGKPRREA